MPPSGQDPSELLEASTTMPRIIYRHETPTDSLESYPWVQHDADGSKKSNGLRLVCPPSPMPLNKKARIERIRFVSSSTPGQISIPLLEDIGVETVFRRPQLRPRRKRQFEQTLMEELHLILPSGPSGGL